MSILFLRRGPLSTFSTFCFLPVESPFWCHSLVPPLGTHWTIFGPPRHIRGGIFHRLLFPFNCEGTPYLLFPSSFLCGHVPPPSSHLIYLRATFLRLCRFNYSLFILSFSPCCEKLTPQISAVPPLYPPPMVPRNPKVLLEC